MNCSSQQFAGLFGMTLIDERRINPDAPVLVVVAEILLNRLLNPDSFDFSGVSSVVWMNFIHSMIPNGYCLGIDIGSAPGFRRTLLLT